jgi:Zn2+/Cd2+-exporting ATPase
MSVEVGTVNLPRMDSDDPNGCIDCAERVAGHLRGRSGVINVEVIGAPARLNYTYQPATITANDVETLVAEALSGVSPRLVHRSLAIEGMDCDNCARTLERGVQRL